MQSTLSGAEVKRAREAVGASKTEIAAAVGLNRTYYSLFEAGRYVLDASEEKRLRELLSAGGARMQPGPHASAQAGDDEGRQGELTESVRRAGNTVRITARWLEGWNLWDWWPTPKD